MVMSEAEWVQQAIKKDAGAWEQIVAAHQQAVFRLAYLMLRDAAEAEDIAQETFIRAYHALPRFDTARPLRPWLLSIAVNLVRNQRRAVGRYLHALYRWWSHAPPPEPMEARTAAELEAKSLWQAVQRLPRSDQEVLYLRFFLDLSEQETADALGIPRGTVKSRQHRAVERLRTVVAQEFPTLQAGRAHERTT